MRFERPQTLVALAVILAFAPLLLLPLAWAEDPAGAWMKQDIGVHRVLAQNWLEARDGLLVSVKGAGVWFAPASGGWEHAGDGLPVHFRDGLSVTSLAKLSGKGSAILALTSAGAIYRSWDEGQHWEVVAAPTDSASIGRLVATRGGAVYLVAQPDIYVSDDAGGTWRLAGALPADARPSCAIADLLGPASLLVGTDDGRIVISRDGGRAWKQPEMFLARGRLQAIAGDSADALFAATSFGLLRSNDGGESWHSASPDLQGKDVRDLIVESGRPMTLYAGLGRGGVWRSLDGGESWAALGRGLERRGVTGLTFDVVGRALYVGAQDGVWRLVLADAPAIPSPQPAAGPSATTAPTVAPPVATPSVRATGMPTATRPATPSPTATITPTRRLTETPTVTPTMTRAPSRTFTPTLAATATTTLTPSPEPTATVSVALPPTQEPQPTQVATPPR